MRGTSASTTPICIVVVERWETRDDLNAPWQGAAHEGVARDSSPMKTAPTVIEIISDAKVEKF